MEQLELNKEVLAEVFGQVLEDAAFMFAVPNDAPEPWKEIPLQVTLNFVGPRNGFFRITLDTDCSKNIAANMLGVNEINQLNEKDYEDSICELLNMVTGNMLGKWFGESAMFTLHPPTLNGPTAEKEIPQGAICIFQDIDVDDTHRIMIEAMVLIK